MPVLSVTSEIPKRKLLHPDCTCENRGSIPAKEWTEMTRARGAPGCWPQLPCGLPGMCQQHGADHNVHRCPSLPATSLMFVQLTLLMERASCQGRASGHSQVQFFHRWGVWGLSLHLEACMSSPSRNSPHWLSLSLFMPPPRLAGGADTLSGSLLVSLMSVGLLVHFQRRTNVSCLTRVTCCDGRIGLMAAMPRFVSCRRR